MPRRLRNWLSRAKRALDFAMAHPVAGASFATIIARLQALVTAADALVMQQTEGTTTEHAALARRVKVRRTVLRYMLNRLIATTTIASKDHEELVNLLPPLRDKAANHVYLLLAKTMLATAMPQKDLLISYGLGETFFDNVADAISQFESATEAAHGGRTGHVSAVGLLPQLVKQCNQEVKLLNAYMRVVYADDPDMLAAWSSASNVVVRSRKAADPVEPPPAPAPDGPPAAG